MKIALVSPYDFAYPGGVVNHIIALEHQLARLGQEVHIIAPASRMIPQYGDRFIPIGKPFPFRASDSTIRVPISLWLASKIKEVLAREKFEIIHLHEPFMPMLCSAVLRFSQTTNVGTFHAYEGKPGYNFAKPISTMMLKRRAGKLHGRIAVSKPAMEFASKYVPGSYAIIPNGVDLERFTPDVLPIERFCDGKLNILFVGRLEKRKGLGYLIEAFGQLKQKIDNCRLIVVGPGTKMLKKYAKQVEHSGLRDVVFVGRAADGELPGYYKTADIFCTPAIGRESFGVVLLEAMAMGKPVVASNIEGYANIITHGEEGLLVPPEDSAGLAQAILSLITDGSRRQQMGNKGRRKVENYSWELVARRVLDYYHSVLERISHPTQ